jgi:hypothetical protein
MKPLITLAIGLALVTHAAASEVYRCHASNGRIIYSDSPCSTIGAKPIGMVDTTPNEIPAQRPRLVNPPVRQSSSVAASAPPATVSSPARDSEARRQRENELNNFMSSLASTYEQKSAAQEELSLIAARGGVCKLTDDQRKTRDALYNDLGSLIQVHRVAARGPLSSLLRACETM